MSQYVIIESLNYSGDIANVLFVPDNDNITINLGNKQIPFTFDPSTLTPQREIYGTYTIAELETGCTNILVIPRPQPENPKIYFGKYSGETITSGDVTNLTIKITNNPTNNFVTYPLGSGYGYILIPTTIPQPTDFKNSSGGCFGFNIPINNIGQIIIVDGNGFPINYNIYRTHNSFFGTVNCWLCN